jgi:hypothetical protein
MLFCVDSSRENAKARITLYIIIVHVFDIGMDRPTLFVPCHFRIEHLSEDIKIEQQLLRELAIAVRSQR